MGLYCGPPYFEKPPFRDSCVGSLRIKSLKPGVTRGLKRWDEGRLKDP